MPAVNVIRPAPEFLCHRQNDATQPAMRRMAIQPPMTAHRGLNLRRIVGRLREKLHLNPVPLQEIYERWIAKFEKPRLKALSDLKRRLEKAKG
jgi:hypothetical protein